MTERIASLTSLCLSIVAACCCTYLAVDTAKVKRDSTEGFAAALGVEAGPLAAGFVDLAEGTAPSASAAGHQRLYADSSTHVPMMSINGGGYETVSIGPVAQKASSTSRTSTITRSDDPDLSLNLVVGTYEYEAHLEFANDSDVPGVNTRFGGTVTATTNADIQFVIDANNSAVLEANGGTTYDAAVATVDDFLITSSGTIVVTAGGTFTVSWAQNTSSVAATTLKAGSWLRARRVQ